MIATFARFDIRNQATTQPSRMLIPLAFVLVFGATIHLPGLPILAGALIASITVSYPFQGDEGGLLDTLYATSRVNRRAVTIGRYVTSLAIAATAIALGVVVTLVQGALRQEDLNWPLIGTMLLAAFVVAAVTLSVQLPCFFALGFTRGRPMIFIPVALLAVVGWVAGQTGVLDGTSSIESIGAPSALVVALALVLGVALLVASAATAVRLYRGREL